jgi:hypothetical protein
MGDWYCHQMLIGWMIGSHQMLIGWMIGTNGHQMLIGWMIGTVTRC